MNLFPSSQVENDQFLQTVDVEKYFFMKIYILNRANTARDLNGNGAAEEAELAWNKLMEATKIKGN